MQTASKFIQVFIALLFGAHPGLHARPKANAYDFVKKTWNEYPQIWGWKLFRYRRAYKPRCAPKRKAMKKWMNFDPICTVNNRKSTKTRDNTSNFLSPKNCFFERRFFYHKNSKFSIWKLHAQKILKFDWDSLLFLLWFSNHFCIDIDFEAFWRAPWRASALTWGPIFGPRVDFLGPTF